MNILLLLLSIGSAAVFMHGLLLIFGETLKAQYEVFTFSTDGSLAGLKELTNM